MKVLCLIEDLGPGGAQRQLVNLGIELKNRGHNVVFFYYIKSEFYVPILKQSYIEVINEVLPGRLQRILRIRRFIRAGHFDVVISFLSPSNLISSLATLPLKKWKVILGERSANPLILKSLKSRVIRYFYLCGDYVVANSRANMKMVKKVNPYVKESACRVIYNMLDLDIWTPPRNFQFRGNGKLNIVVAASHRKLKNLKGLLAALVKLTPKERENLAITWYGDRLAEPYYDSSYQEGIAFINEHSLDNVIKFFPATKDLHLIMGKADVVSLFSFFEGLPNSVCEGMALGKPVLATRVSDLPLLITRDINGYLCDPFDSQSIADGIRYFLNASEADLQVWGNNSRKRAQELFDKKKIVDEYETLIGSK